MNIFKVLTQNGRKSLVKGILDEQLTDEIVAKLVADQLSKALTNASLSEDKAKKVADAVAKSSDVVLNIFKAAEDGVISSDEAKLVIDSIFKMFNTSLSGALATVKETIISKVP